IDSDGTLGFPHATAQIQHNGRCKLGVESCNKVGLFQALLIAHPCHRVLVLRRTVVCSTRGGANYACTRTIHSQRRAWFRQAEVLRKLLDHRGSRIASLHAVKRVIHEFLKTATRRRNNAHVIGPALWEISQFKLLFESLDHWPHMATPKL